MKYICSNCGEKISDGNNFCAYCGTYTEIKKEENQIEEGKKCWKIFCWSMLGLILLAAICGILSDSTLSTPSNITTTSQEQTVQDIKPKEVPQAPKSIIRTFKGYNFTELYRYPEFGIYLFAMEKEYIPIDDLFDVFTEMRKNLEYGENDSLEVFVYNYKPNVSQVVNAPKTIPAQMLINATNLMPKYVFGGWGWMLNLEVQHKGACQRFATSVHNNFVYEEWFKENSPLCGFVLEQ